MKFEYLALWLSVVYLLNHRVVLLKALSCGRLPEKFTTNVK